MEKTAITEIMLDTRRAKKNGTYPVKIRMTFQRMTRYYPLHVDLTQSDFDKLMESKRLNAEFQSLHGKIFNEYGRVIDIIKDLKEFSFEDFNKVYLKGKVRVDDVEQYFMAYISAKRSLKRIGTAESFEQALKSLLKFHNGKYGLKKLSFNQINPDWLHAYEAAMLSAGKSLATVGVYLRSLRAVMNQAIDDGVVKREKYPFGKRKYVIPSTRRRKKALSQSELSKLFNYSDANEFERKARDFWFLSFYCNGANLFDIAQLRWDAIEDGHIYFVRKKTANTTKGKQSEIVVPINTYIEKIINLYSVQKPGQDLIFPILQGIKDPVEQKVAIKNFTRFVNQHIKSLAKKVGVNEQISTVWARHSFTTSVIRMGGSLEFVQESLGHQNIQTTMNYWAGFDTGYKMEISLGLLNLVNG